MNRLIVPTDFSKSSANGIDFAVLIAKNIEAKVELVHVIKKEEDSLSLIEAKANRANIQHSFESMVQKYKRSSPEIEIETIVKEGKIYQEVIRQAEAFDDSFIVSSTHGSSGWEEFFVGSNVYKIVSSSTKPVFTIRGDIVPGQIKKIVLPLDNSPETREKVPLTAKLAVLFGAQIQILTLSNLDSNDILTKLVDYAAQVSKYLKKLGIKNKIEPLNGNNYTDIVIEYALEEKADLISIMTTQEERISNILLGSYAHQMINKSPVPVLLFPTRQIGIISEGFRPEA